MTVVMDKKINLKMKGEELTVYFTLDLMQTEGRCDLCGDGTKKLLYWSRVEISEVIDSFGNKVSVSKRFGATLKRQITMASGGINYRRCDRHYRDNIPAAI